MATAGSSLGSALIAFASAIVPPDTDRIGLWTIDGETTRWAGVILFVLGGELGVVVSLFMLVPLIARIHTEERPLRAHFGKEYDAYAARTWRLVRGSIE